MAVFRSMIYTMNHLPLENLGKQKEYDTVLSTGNYNGYNKDRIYSSNRLLK
jgi:hypothetical protein